MTNFREQLYFVLNKVLNDGGKVLFDLSGVDIDYVIELFDIHYNLSFEDAEETGKITEWELLQILKNNKYHSIVVFHESENFSSSNVKKIKTYLK